MAPREAQKQHPPGWVHDGPHLGPILGYLGPSLALLGGLGGHLEAYFGFGKAYLGMISGEKVRSQKHQTNIGKSMVFADFLEQGAGRKLATCLFGGFKVVLKS